MMAADKGHSDVRDTLLNAKANPELQDKVSALEMAEQRLIMMQALCGSGVSGCSSRTLR